MEKLYFLYKIWATLKNKMQLFCLSRPKIKYLKILWKERKKKKKTILSLSLFIYLFIYYFYPLTCM